MAIYVREPMDTEDRVSESEFRTGELEVVKIFWPPTRVGDEAVVAEILPN